MLLYVVARKSFGKVSYLMVDDIKESKFDPWKVFFKWTNEIDDACAFETYKEAYDFADKYFKKYKKWYITSYEALV